MVIWLYGYMVIWFHSHVIMWLYGCMLIKLYDCTAEEPMATATPKSTTSRMHITVMIGDPCIQIYGHMVIWFYSFMVI